MIHQIMGVFNIRGGGGRVNLGGGDYAQRPALQSDGPKIFPWNKMIPQSSYLQDGAMLL